MTENEPLLKSQQPTQLPAKIPLGITTVARPNWKVRIKEKLGSCSWPLLSLLIVSLCFFVIFFMANLGGSQGAEKHPLQHIGPTECGTVIEDDYERPPFHQCMPTPQSNPTNGTFEIPTSGLKTLSINITGMASGELHFTPVDKQGPVVFHFLSSSESISAKSVKIHHDTENGSFAVNVITPSSLPHECVDLTVQVDFPIGSFKDLDTFSIKTELLEVYLQLPKVREKLGKKVTIETYSGSIRLANIVDTDLIQTSTQFGRIDTKNLNITAGGAPTLVLSSIITNSLNIRGKGRVDVDYINGKPLFVNIGTKRSTFPIGGFISVRNMDLNEEKGSNVTIKAESAKIDAEFLNFYGDFSVKTDKGKVSIAGDGVQLSTNTSRIKEGKKGEAGLSSLEVEAGKGSSKPNSMSKGERQPLLQSLQQPQQSIQVPVNVPSGSTIVVVPPDSVVRIKRKPLSAWLSAGIVAIYFFLVYLGTFEIPISGLKSLSINVTGMASGILYVIPVDEKGPVVFKLHYHSSSESLPVNISHSNQNGSFSINTITPSYESVSNECINLAIRMDVPIGSFKDLDIFSIRTEHMLVYLESMSVKDKLGKTISVETFSGIIHVSNIVDADLIHIATEHGLSSIQGVETKNLDITSGGPPIDLSSSSVTNSLNLRGSYNVDLHDIRGKPRIVNIGLGKIIFTAESKLRVRNMKLNEEKGTTVTIKAELANIDAEFINFYGNFSVKTDEGHAYVGGDGIQFSNDTSSIKEGKKGTAGLSFLEVDLGQGSAAEVYLK
ncbi:hypothetical protein HDU97_004154 [Phlyctochytrium planicorne]|nr:hypothetical protein HDU97_004154 [Phlyctochytrium planicorne]